jgi:hypothetical protein
MSTDNSIQIQILKTDYKKMNRYPHFKMEYVDKNNFSEYVDDLKQVIMYIQKQLTDWPEAPNYTEVLKRFEGDSRCLLFYYNNSAIGWNWFNPNVALDWKTTIQELPENEVYGGGCFVTTLVDRPANSGMINYNMYFEYMLEILGYDVAYGYVENWNRTAKRVNFANGATFNNFLKENLDN